MGSGVPLHPEDVVALSTTLLQVVSTGKPLALPE
jgi:hypothetical protein